MLEYVKDFLQNIEETLLQNQNSLSSQIGEIHEKKTWKIKHCLSKLVDVYKKETTRFLLKGP